MDEVQAMFQDRERELILYDLDQVFGINNPISSQIRATGTIQGEMILRGVVRQMRLMKERLDVLEGKVGVTRP